MNAGLIWTAIGSAAGVLGLALVAWQVRLQHLERRERQQPQERGSERADFRANGLPVAVPMGRLPPEVRGRDALLAELRGSLARRPRRPGRTWVLAGMGGLGKSTVALAFAEMARNEGWQVWWVTATDGAALTGGILEVLYQLGASESVTRPVREGTPTAATRAWDCLNGTHAAGRRWLLILDNADTPAVLAAAGATSPADYAGWLRPDPTGVVVVTTRTVDPRVWGPRVVLRVLQPLGDAAAAQMLADLAPNVADPTGEQAEALGRRLGGLPLALHLAGTYLASPFARWDTFAAYQQALDSGELPHVLADLDEVGGQARDTIQRTWNLSLEGLAADGRPQARPLLFLLSCYASAIPIPTGLLRPEQLSGLLCHQPPSPAVPEELESARRWVREGLNGLAAVGLIDTSSGGDKLRNAITLHPVVADANRSQLLAMPQSDLSAIGCTAVRLLQKACEKLDSTNPSDWSAWRLLTPHMNALLEWLSAYLDADAIISLTAASDPAADALWRSGDLAGAERLARSTASAACRLGEDHPVALAARYTLATTIAFQGRYGEGEKVYRQTGISQGQEPGNHPPDGAPSRSGSEPTADWLHRYGEAERMYRELLPDLQRVLGDDHPDSLRARHRLAWVIALQGRCGEAEQIYRELLPDQQRILGDVHPDALNSLHRLAWVIGLQGRHGEAEQIYRELIPDYRRELGYDDPTTLAARHRLAWVIALQGRYGEAEQIYRELIPSERQVLGDDHPDTLATRQRLAWVIALQGRNGEAEQMYRQLLSDQQRILGNDHPDTLTTRRELTRAFTEQRRVAGCSM